MSYTAKHYVRISGRKYTPGEIIDIPIPKERLSRLLRLHAIECNAIDAILNEASYGADERGDDESDAERDAGHEDRMDRDATENGEDADEAPEIDVMDGIVSNAEAQSETASAKKETEKKASARGRKKA